MGNGNSTEKFNFVLSSTSSVKQMSFVCACFAYSVPFATLTIDRKNGGHF